MTEAAATDTDRPTLSAVLPLSIRGSYDVDDLGRVSILFRSLVAFAAAGTFDRILIVTPPEEVAMVEARIGQWTTLPLDVMSEEALLPELAKHRHVRGWRKQQLVKLGAHRALDSDFLLTLDADVICLKPISREILLPSGRALIQYEQRSQHPKWWRSSARLLNMSPNIGDTRIGMTITPALLARDLCRSVTDALTPSSGDSWVDRLCALHNPRSPYNWTPHRFLRAKWTEYSLYYLNALRQQQLLQFHIDAGTASVPQLMITHDSHPFESWNAEHSFSAAEPALFCVVGSKSRLTPEVVWSRISHLVPDTPGGS